VVLHPGFVELEFLIWQFFDMVLHRCAHEASSALDRLERPISKGPVQIALPFFLCSFPSQISCPQSHHHRCWTDGTTATLYSCLVFKPGSVDLYGCKWCFLASLIYSWLRFLILVHQVQHYLVMHHVLVSPSRRWKWLHLGAAESGEGITGQSGPAGRTPDLLQDSQLIVH
jgi:hypothetical protein